MTEAEATAIVRFHLDRARRSPFDECVERARARRIDQVEFESEGLHCRRVELAYYLEQDGSVRLEGSIEEAGIPLLQKPIVETVRPA